MLSQELREKIRQELVGAIQLPTRTMIEAIYPPRQLAAGSEVTRVCPSPTGFVHIGNIFTAMLCERVARQTDGVYILRIEDTDKKRELAGAKELIASQLGAFGLTPDEGLQPDGSVKGDYGPYVQSERQALYLTYALELLESGRAYPCFATAEELQAAVADQQAKKLRPGYYGEWALWRDQKEADVQAALSAGKPFVLRFRSEGSHERRITFSDVIKSDMSLPENDLDVPLIKSDESRLPTYHLAHVVDDFLMRTTIVMRGEEWLPSTPLHMELCDALGIPRFRYAHTPVISIVGDAGGKRKLSKRKDPEADVAFWQKQAYPLRAVKAYLLGLANSNFEDWYRENPTADLTEFAFSLEKLASSRSPLLDMKKVEDYAKDEIAQLPQEKFNKEVLMWCELHDPALFRQMMAEPDYTKAVLAIERGGEKPRKDVAKWSDVPELFGYFYDSIFANQEPEALDLPAAVISKALEHYVTTYSHDVAKDVWFEHMKESAEKAGFSVDRSKLKANPDKYHGGIADFAKIIRVKLTGKTRTPDLYTIMQIMGEQRVRSRLS